MLTKAIILGLIGVFCILDSRMLGRLNFERPLITCTLVGIVLGDLQTGLAVGASMELISLGLVTIGGAVPPDMCMAAIITSGFTIMTSASMETALGLAMPIAVLGQFIGVVGRTVLGSLTHVADKAIEENKFKKATSMHIVWGTIIYSLLYFVPIFLAVYAGTDVVEAIVRFIPAWLTDGLNLATKFLTAYGLALLMSIMLNKKMTVYFLLGFFLVGYLGLNITAIAIFATILAFILNSMKSVPAVSGGASAADDYDPLEDDL
ncbi:MAG: PTS sugar transporter subunit IIC [Eubacteriales bacterium]|nr:PTS sugar transporter subunit IIC [Eubacteriales bacterium]